MSDLAVYGVNYEQVGIIIESFEPKRDSYTFETRLGYQFCIFRGWKRRLPECANAAKGYQTSDANRLVVWQNAVAAENRISISFL